MMQTLTSVLLAFEAKKWEKIEPFMNVSLNVQTLKQDLGQTKRDMDFNPLDLFRTK